MGILFSHRHIMSTIIILLLGVTAVFAQDAPSTCSVNSEVEMVIVVTNSTGRDLNLNWIDYDCVEQTYATFASGETVVQPTYASHPWILRTADTGVQVGEVILGDSPRTIVRNAACSIGSDFETSVTISNTSQTPQKIYWVDYDCAEAEFGELASGETIVQSTFDTHPWVLRDAETGTFLSMVISRALTAPAG